MLMVDLKGTVCKPEALQHAPGEVTHGVVARTRDDDAAVRAGRGFTGRWCDLFANDVADGNPAVMPVNVAGVRTVDEARRIQRVVIEEGEHRFVATLDGYEDAEKVESVKSNNQKIELTLSSNFGWLEMKPVMNEAANRGVLNVTVDGVRKDDSRIELEAGFHDVRVTHPCYDPVEFRVSIAKNKTETFDKELVRGKGGLELNVEYKGEPQAVPVIIDGEDAGSTPYTGEVPLCAEVMLQGNGWTEKVNVQPKWHEVVQVTHKLMHSPEAVAMPGDATRTNAKVAYNELDGKNSNQAKADQAASDVQKDKGGKKIHWVPIAISGGVAVIGAAMALGSIKRLKMPQRILRRIKRNSRRGMTMLKSTKPSVIFRLAWSWADLSVLV